MRWGGNRIRGPNRLPGKGVQNLGNMAKKGLSQVLPSQLQEEEEPPGGAGRRGLLKWVAKLIHDSFLLFQLSNHKNRNKNQG